MSYLHTQDINVFPSARRGNKQVSARLMTEASIVGIINKLIDRKGFVITPALDITPTNSFEFNIFGYYFNVNPMQTILDLFDDTTLDIYGAIIIERTGNYNELWGQDEPDSSNTNFVYKGIQFLSEEPTNSLLNNSNQELYYLWLLHRDGIDSNWYVPEQSRIKFEFSSLPPDLDGGEIE